MEVLLVWLKNEEESDFNFHKLEAHEGKRCSCYQCNYEVTSKQSLKTHNEVVHEGVEYLCDDCKLSNRMERDIKIHSLWFL